MDYPKPDYTQDELNSANPAAAREARIRASMTAAKSLQEGSDPSGYNPEYKAAKPEYTYNPTPRPPAGASPNDYNPSYRAKAFSEQLSPIVKDGQTYSGGQPSDSVKVPDAYGRLPGKDAYGRTVVSNHRSRGGIDTLAGATDAERERIKADYSDYVNSYREQHPDDTMSYGGQDFVMPRTIPRLRAQALAEQLTLIRGGNESAAKTRTSDAEIERLKAESNARIAKTNALTEGTALENKKLAAKLQRDSDAYNAAAGLRQMTAEEEVTQKKREIILNKLNGETEFSDATFAAGKTAKERAAEKFAMTVKPEDLAKYSPKVRAFIVGVQARGMGAPDEVVSDLTRPVAGQEEIDLEEEFNRSPVLKGDLREVLANVDEGGNRNWLATSVGGLADWLNKIPGGGDVGGDIGGVLPEDVDTAKRSVTALAKKMVANRQAKDVPSATRLLIDHMYRTGIATARTKAGKQMRAELLKMIPPDPTEFGAQPQGQSTGSRQPPAGQEYNF